MNITEETKTTMQTATVPLYIFGEVLFDIFPDGTQKLGGAPFNVAWHLHAFGAAPRLISGIGNDPLGDRAIEAIKAWGMNTDHITRAKDAPTGAVNVHFNHGENEYEIAQNTAFDIGGYAYPKDLQQPSLLYHGTLALRGDKNKEYLHQLNTRGSFRKFIDVNLRPPFWNKQTALELIQSAYCVKLSNDELRELLDQDIVGIEQLSASSKPKDLEPFALAFKTQHHIANLIVTCGADGAFMLNEVDEIIDTGVPHQQVDVEDTVGAGDAFSSIMILGITRDWEWSVCLERAQQFANYIVSIRGAITDNRSIYEDLKTFWCLD